jgi:hypothetical protein
MLREATDDIKEKKRHSNMFIYHTMDNQADMAESSNIGKNILASMLRINI